MASEPHCDKCKNMLAHTYFITRGIDGQKVLDEANLQWEHGFKTKVHYHPNGHNCNERCVTHR